MKENTITRNEALKILRLRGMSRTELFEFAWTTGVETTQSEVDSFTQRMIRKWEVGADVEHNAM
tara:strand:- start:437 stop:628 length:192 start_codon:yes stop_codon:yes gene_type:complete